MALAFSFHVLGGMLMLKHEDSSALFGKPCLCWVRTLPSGICCFEAFYFQATASKLGPLRLHSSPMSKRSLAGYPPHHPIILISIHPSPNNVKHLWHGDFSLFTTSSLMISWLISIHRSLHMEQLPDDFPYKTWSMVRWTNEVTGNYAEIIPVIPHCWLTPLV